MKSDYAGQDLQHYNNEDYEATFQKPTKQGLGRSGLKRRISSHSMPANTTHEVTATSQKPRGSGPPRTTPELLQPESGHALQQTTRICRHSYVSQCVQEQTGQRVGQSKFEMNTVPNTGLEKTYVFWNFLQVFRFFQVFKVFLGYLGFNVHNVQCTQCRTQIYDPRQVAYMKISVC